jgi:hypothetical protein
VTRRRWVVVGVVAAVVTAVVALTGSGLPKAVAAGALCVLVVVLATAVDLGQHVALPRLPFGRRDGSRTEVSSLEWAMTGEIVSPHAQRQLRRVATTGLADAGIDLDDAVGRERASALLGPVVVAFLTEPGAPPPDSRGVQSTVLALEKLEQTT